MPTHPYGAELNIANGIREFAIASPRATAVIDGERTLTYAELDARASRVANALLAAGVATGDRVAIMLGNRLEFCEIACGIAKAGAVSVPINPRLTATEVAHIVGHSGARTMIVESSLLETARTALAEHGLQPLAVLDDDYEGLLDGASDVDPRIPVVETEPFTISYTSGTTGKPKGVMISHRSRSLTFYMAALEWDLGPGKTTIAVAPMYHGAGFALGYAACHTGGTLVMLRHWSARELLELVALHRPTSVFLVPAHVQMLRELGDDVIRSFDLSSLTTVYTNAAPMPFALKAWLLELLPSIGLHDLYGSTEASIVTCLRPADQLRKPGSVGPPWLLTEVRIVKPDGSLAAPGERGELWSRSPYVFSGYYRDPEATARATTDDGFVSAGDVAVWDEDNCISIVDRLSDLIITGGVNVHPSEVEAVLASHPGVRESAVVGAPDEKWGERVVAVVVPEGAEPTADELLEHCRAQLAGFKIPKEIRFVPALPRNTAGKILKRELRAAFD